jgi:hypothetical protein
MSVQGLISPKKDYGTGELLLGAASVSQGTFLLIDETCLEAGQLVEQGVKNVQAIHALIGAKELEAGDERVVALSHFLDFNVFATFVMLSKLINNAFRLWFLSHYPSLGRHDLDDQQGGPYIQTSASCARHSNIAQGKSMWQGDTAVQLPSGTTRANNDRCIRWYNRPQPAIVRLHHVCAQLICVTPRQPLPSEISCPVPMH